VYAHTGLPLCSILSRVGCNWAYVSSVTKVSAQLNEFDLMLGAQALRTGKSLSLGTGKLGVCSGVADLLCMQTLRSAAKLSRLDKNTF